MKLSTIEGYTFLMGGCAMLLAVSPIVRFSEWLPWVLFAVMFFVGFVSLILMDNEKEGSVVDAQKEPQK